VVEQLLPVQPVDTEGLQEHWDYIYEPGGKDILDGLLMRTSNHRCIKAR